jgi:RNase P/RNase MRP subunit POP5
LKVDEVDKEKVEREEVEEEIRDCTKACWGNLGACHLALVRSWYLDTGMS